MPIRRDVSPGEFQAASYMVELYWVACMRPKLGVMVFMTTSVSNRSGRIGDWEAFFLEGLRPGCILSYTEGHQLGYVSGAFPDAASYPTMAGYLTDKFVYVYHAWVGYSHDKFTVDEQYFAIDFYWQEPGSIMSDRYHWYVLRDVNEPVNWYRARQVLICGHRSFGIERMGRL